MIRIWKTQRRIQQKSLFSSFTSVFHN